MTDFRSIVSNITNYFSSKPGFSDVLFTTEYPALKKSQPLSRPTVSVGIESVDDRKTDNVYDETVTPKVLLYNRETSVNLRFIIHVPQNRGGLKCYEILTRLDSAIMDTNFNYSFDRIRCDGIEYNRDIGAFVQKVIIGITERTITTS